MKHWGVLMANGHGGYRQPANPAPVSAPGALSQRTDTQPVRNPGGMPYGDNADFADIQSSAPMAATQQQLPTAKATGRAAGQAAAQSQAAPLTPLHAPSTRPDEPVTAGAALGPGPGVESMGLNPVQSQYQSALQMFSSLASSPNASPAMKALAQRIQQGF